MRTPVSLRLRTSILGLFCLYKGPLLTVILVASAPEIDGLNTSVRLFGFREMDPERRHKAQFNGCSCKHSDTLSKQY